MKMSKKVCVLWIVAALIWILWEGGEIVGSRNPETFVEVVNDATRMGLLEGMRTAVLNITTKQDYDFPTMMRLSAEMLTVVNHEKDPSSVTNNLTCPPNPHQGVRKRNGCINCSKYKRYVSYCDTTGTLFMDVRLPSFIHVMDTIAKKASFKPGMRILDWGSGCGTKLNYWRMRYGVHGIGLDYTKVIVDYATERSRDGLTFCWADGSKALKYFPDNSFDRVVSHSALYHVMPVKSQCKVVLQAVRITKPGGIIWFGHFRSSPAIKFWKRGAFKACPQLLNLNVDAHIWKDTHIFEGKESWYKTINAITLVIMKKESNLTSQGSHGSTSSGSYNEVGSDLSDSHSGSR